MAVGIGAAGVVGVALETLAAPGTYVAPTKFFPITSESLSHSQNTNWRRVIRGTVDPLGAIGGDTNLGGDIEMEALPDSIIYFLLCARCDTVKTGVASPFTYEFTGNHLAEPVHTMSITVVRNGVVFGYTGMCVGSFEFNIDNGALMVRFSMFGQVEDVESAPTPTYSNQEPFGAGSYVVEIPDGNQVYTLDGFTFSVDDSASPQFRLRDDRTSPSYIAYGERTTTLNTNLDFDSRDDYDDYKDLTAQAITVQAVGEADRQIEFTLPAMIIDTYEVGLSGPGDIVQASVDYQGVHDATVGAAWRITVLTDEDMTIPAV